MKTRILYISGLGDSYDGFRRGSVALWRVFGVESSVVASKWYDGEDYQVKLARLESEIYAAHAAKRRIVLIGESAGAALALVAGQDDRVSRTITLCGVASPHMPIVSGIRRRSPAFVEAVNELKTVKVDGVISLRAAYDPTVLRRYSVWPGSRESVILSAGHLLTIFLCLTVFSPRIIWAAKKQKL